MLPPGPPPAPPRDAQPPAARPFWKRVPTRVWIIGGIVVVALLIGWITGRGKTDAQNLEVGDCFEAPSTLAEITDVNDQPCEGPHDYEIVAVVQAPADMEYPSGIGFGLDADDGQLACDAAIPEDRIVVENIPDDITAGYFYPDRREWDDGDRELICFAASETGIPGPLLSPAP